MKEIIFQDGGQFYTLEGNLIADYSSMVKGDYDLVGAQAARKQFLKCHPNYQVYSDVE
jgi:hypothetical protein